jgi:hypothetical protein
MTKELNLQNDINIILKGKSTPKLSCEAKEYYRNNGRKFPKNTPKEMQQQLADIVLNKIHVITKFEYDNWEEVLNGKLSLLQVQIDPRITPISSSNSVLNTSTELTGAMSAGNSPNQSPPSTELQNASIEQNEKGRGVYN